MVTSKRKLKADTEMESRVASLEDRVAKLEEGVPGKRKRRTRDYTDEERAAIRGKATCRTGSGIQEEEGH